MVKNLTSIGLIAGILLLVNFLSKDFFFRIDTTKEKAYTLSKATKNILKKLEEPVTVSAYFTEDLPPQLAKSGDDFKDFLTEYATRSKGMVNYEFIDPSGDQEKEQEAMQNGIQPLQINVREKDEVAMKRAYLGAVVKVGDRQEILPVIQPQSPMEYMLTTAIKKLSVIEKPSVALIQGHGEPDLNSLSAAFQAMSILNNVEPLDLMQSESIDFRFKTVLWVNPADSIPASEFTKMDEFLSRGGNMCIAMNAVTGDFQTAQGTALTTGLETWLADKGLQVNGSFVIDASSGSVSVRQQQGFFTINSQVQFPYFPKVTAFEEHPITQGLEQVTFQFASPLNFTGQAPFTFTPLVKTSNKSGILNLPVFFDVQRQWRNSDFPMQNVTIGGILEGDFGSNGTNGRIVMFTDGDFPIGGQAQGVFENNIYLLVNSVDWLTDDTGLIQLRTKGVTTRPIKEMEEGKIASTKWFNFLFPIVLVILYGLFRLQINRRKRVMREHEDFG